MKPKIQIIKPVFKMKKISKNQELKDLAASQIDHYQLLTGAGFEIDYKYYDTYNTTPEDHGLIVWRLKDLNNDMRVFFMKDGVVSIRDLILSVIKSAKADVKNKAKILFCD